MSLLVAALPALLASAVEFVEAYTIVLAVGLTRGWRPAGAGAAAAIATLALAVAGLGSTVLRSVDRHAFQLVVGVLLLLFGLRWLRKAILRAAGLIALHDEDAIYHRTVTGLRAAAAASGFDWAAFLISFKATALEGLEVVFIVLALGTAGGCSLLAAVVGAMAAFVLVSLLGVAARRPLSRVPENSLKFGVGLLLTTFGVFWTAEGLGVAWPGDALSLLGLLAAGAALSGVAVRLLDSPCPLLAGGGS